MKHKFPTVMRAVPLPPREREDAHHEEAQQEDHQEHVEDDAAVALPPACRCRVVARPIGTANWINYKPSVARSTVPLPRRDGEEAQHEEMQQEHRQEHVEDETVVALPPVYTGPPAR